MDLQDISQLLRIFYSIKFYEIDEEFYQDEIYSLLPKLILNETKINNLMRFEEVVDNYLDLDFDVVWWNEIKQKIQEKKDYLF